MALDPKILKIKPGWHTGYVKEFKPASNTILVLMDGIPRPCLWAAGIISGMIGLKTSYFPPYKTRVLVIWPDTGDLGYIIGTLPSPLVDGASPRRDMLDDDSSKYADKNVFHVSNSNQSRVFVGHKPPVDLAEGELNVENWMGVGLSLLRNIASLQASDLARVECHLLDDMVRIISDTFRHYTAFGDYKISNDGGKLNVIWNGTSHDFEAWGNQHSTDPKAHMTSRTNVSENLVDAGQADDGRWRFTQYIGWLGNFINSYVTDPVNAIGKIAEGQFRSGKARIHVNDDGAVLVQSVADIVLEKVVRIPVPNQLRKEDDPQGDLSDSTLSSDPLKTWKPTSETNLFEMAFQLREYARWLNNAYSLGRFRQMTRDWEVPTEHQTPAPDLNSSDPDKRTVNSGVSNWRTAYATIRIYRDGSIQTVDAYGNAMTTTAVGIQISSPRDILIQAGGSVNIVAGRDINLVAQQNVNLSAITQALRLSSATAMQFICSAGNMVTEVAVGFWHKIIGQSSHNNTVSVMVDGSINALSSVTAEKLFAVLSVDAPAVFSKQTFQTEPNQEYDSHGDTEANHTWLSLDAPSVSLSLPSVTDHFTFQTDYSPGTLYQTVTQQALTIQDVVPTPTPGSVLGASVGAAAGVQAAIAAAAAIINAKVPGAVDPVTGAINAAAGALPPVETNSSLTAAVNGVTAAATKSVSGLASKAGSAAAAATKLLHTPVLQNATNLASAVQSKVQGYITATTSALISPVTVSELKAFAVEIQNPLGSVTAPSVGALASYTQDISVLSDIQSTVGAAGSTLSSAVAGIKAEVPGVPTVPSIPGLPVGAGVPSLSSVMTGNLASASGVASSAAKSALSTYGSKLKL